jgi:hypothetical protein
MCCITTPAKLRLIMCRTLEFFYCTLVSIVLVLCLHAARIYIACLLFSSYSYCDARVACPSAILFSIRGGMSACVCVVLKRRLCIYLQRLIWKFVKSNQ